MILVSAALVGAGSAVFHPEASRVARMASGGRYGLAQSVFQVGGNAGSSLGPLLAAVIVMPRGHGQPYIAWFCLVALAGHRRARGRGSLVRRAFACCARRPPPDRSRQECACRPLPTEERRAKRPTREIAFAIGVLIVLIFLQVFLPGEHDELLSVLPDRPFRTDGPAGAGASVHLPRGGGGRDHHRRAGRATGTDANW